MKIKLVHKSLVSPKAPYHFDYSVENPSHYPTPTGRWEHNRIWFTMRWQRKPIGIRLVNKSTMSKPCVEIAVYSKTKMNKNNTEALKKELAYRFEWFADYIEFNKRFEKDRFLKEVIKKLKGMRMFCAEDLYSYLMIAILLQNANVKRTVKMTQVMLENYGDLLEFDGEKHFCFWSPEKLVKVSEEELRTLKVGYRAKTFLRVSKEFAEGMINEMQMRNLDSETLKKELLKIYGVGPASLDYLMRDVFHRYDALNTVPPWEAKIYSQLFKKEADAKETLDEIKKRYGEWRAVAVHYIFMDLNWS
ncbi:MAG: hypothetical protein KKB25_03780, partial [Nanoarchaeota archaeon]|nr:hypothetical protein [Nanoarchaeota archaeon]